MRAVVLRGVGQGLETDDDHVEPVVGDGETLIEVTACGVCGSDLQIGRAHV